MDLVGSAQWAQYKDVINSGHDTFNQEDIVWLRSNGGLDRNGEDNLTESFQAINLKCLVEYNAFRKWPINQTTDTGELDRQTEAIYLNIKYLRELGFMTPSGIFTYQQDADRIIHEGIKYKVSAITNICQAQDEPLLSMLVLQREEIQTGDDMGNLPIPIGTGLQWPLPDGAQSFTFTNQTVVACNHGLGRFPQVAIYNTLGNEIEGEVFQNPNNMNLVVISFNSPQSGIIIID